MPLLSFDRANQWVPLDFVQKTDKMKLPLHEFSFVKATATSEFLVLVMIDNSLDTVHGFHTASI